MITELVRKETGFREVMKILAKGVANSDIAACMKTRKKTRRALSTY